jgi:hypothetical protein
MVEKRGEEDPFHSVRTLVLLPHEPQQKLGPLIVVVAAGAEDSVVTMCSGTGRLSCRCRRFMGRQLAKGTVDD